jgi:hypothetical protein
VEEEGSVRPRMSRRGRRWKSTEPWAEEGEGRREARGGPKLAAREEEVTGRFEEMDDGVEDGK